MIDFTRVLSGPYCTMVLADMGARVIKIERPGPGDFARAYDSLVHGESSWFVWLNRGKESLALDLGIVGVWAGLVGLIAVRLATCAWRFSSRRWALVGAPRS